MTDIAVDLEFIEDGKTIEIISVAMVDENNRTLYLLNQDVDLGKIMANEWLMENVVPKLPLKVCDTGKLEWDLNSIAPQERHSLMPLREMAEHVRDFVTSRPKPKLWGWYCAYDHVALCMQLFGKMISLPEGYPMWMADVKQLADELGDPELPELPGRREHHALDDAREVMMRLKWLRAYQRYLGLSWPLLKDSPIRLAAESVADRNVPELAERAARERSRRGHGSTRVTAGRIVPLGQVAYEEGRSDGYEDGEHSQDLT